MSTLKVSSIQNASTSSGGVSIDTSGHVTVDSVAMPSAGPLSNRNLIINGAMQVWQRGTAFTSSAFGGGRYTADRWNVPNRTRAARSTDAPAGFTYSLLIDRELTSGAEPFTVSTGIEVQDITQTGSYTLSFYAKSADITTLNINVQDRTGVAEGGTNNSSIVTDEAITIDNTWTRYTHTFTISSVSFTGTSLRISIGNTSAAQDDEALITGVQLEVGSVATPFEHRSFGDELAKCKRYFTDIGGTACHFRGTNSDSLGTTIPTPVQMRATPSISNLSIGSCRMYNASGVNFGSASASVNAANGAMYDIFVSGLSGVTDNAVGFINFTADLASEL